MVSAKWKTDSAVKRKVLNCIKASELKLERFSQLASAIHVHTTGVTPDDASTGNNLTSCSTWLHFADLG